ncbi:HepT-like ribonuclease domain-containing protein [Pectobacterium sp. LFLA-215]|uniref:HepT-like ribonuclease domain-containing protein n=1 Tax=Pectobacterium sp. LFLA-215 TaxID=3419008 RepID=UPI003F5BB3EF
MQKMVGLRNIAVHDYQALNLDIVIHVIYHRLSDFEHFIKQIAWYSDSQHL